VLDFFNYTKGKFVIVSPFPTSVQNAYGFIKSALYRRLSQLFTKNEPVSSLIKRAIDPGGDERINSTAELITAVKEIDRESASIVDREIDNFNVKLVVNMTKSEEDARVGDIVKVVADKYLSITVDVLRSVPFDTQVEKSILLTNPLLLNETGSKIAMSIYEIAVDMMKDTRVVN
jgi:flagellar biosynthesis protein FlhG